MLPSHLDRDIWLADVIVERAQSEAKAAEDEIMRRRYRGPLHGTPFALKDIIDVAGMVERHWDCFAEKPWACTLNSVDWLCEGFSVGKLDHLGMKFGWFYDGHQALADCEACLALLAQTLPKSERRVMAVVREAALQDDYLVRAVDAPYDLRDKLKQRGYRWRSADLPNGKVWWTMTTDPEAEIGWLRGEVYGREAEVPVHPITARERFSERQWDFGR